MPRFSHRQSRFLLVAAFGVACSYLANAATGSPATASPSHLANISTRLNVGAGDDVLIGGFIVRGSNPKKLILRAIGPSLIQAGVSGAMTDPVLELHDSAGAIIAVNDNWQVGPQASEIASSGLAPANPLESAIMATLSSGNYTAIVHGANDVTGISLIEVFELDSTATRLVNISARGLVGSADGVLIGGLIISGSNSKPVILRAIGPSLGLVGALTNPVLELHDGSGNLMSSNDDWTTGAQSSTIAASGLAPSNPRESAILATLSPGNYTAIVHGANDATGVALLESYDLDPDPKLEVWIAVRADGAEGSGTAAYPYDGSTPEKFDARLSAIAANAIIHLGAGTFRTHCFATDAGWQLGNLKPGWTVQGAGMYDTTIQAVGSVAGIHYNVHVLQSPYSKSTDGVVLRDFTVDCNWAELGPTADMGPAGEKQIAVDAVLLYGSNNLIERCRHINTFGASTTNNEEFGFMIAAPFSTDVTGNAIRSCRAESPAGGYGSAFNISGWIGSPNRFVTNSQITDCVAIGINNGLSWGKPGFTTGAAGFANAKDCEVSGNLFIDCVGIFYCDTGSLENIRIANNTLVRGWFGVGLVADGPGESWTKTNVQIIDNNINIQNRSVGGASWAVAIFGAASSGLVIERNSISFDCTGHGTEQFNTLGCFGIADGIISDNVADEASASPATVNASAIGAQLCSNRTMTGTEMTNLADTCK